MENKPVSIVPQGSVPASKFLPEFLPILPSAMDCYPECKTNKSFPLQLGVGWSFVTTTEKQTQMHPHTDRVAALTH